MLSENARVRQAASRSPGWRWAARLERGRLLPALTGKSVPAARPDHDRLRPSLDAIRERVRRLHPLRVNGRAQTGRDVLAVDDAALLAVDLVDAGEQPVGWQLQAEIEPKCRGAIGDGDES